jgi:2-ketocyclohexanecarboxyl-CoA hydrolase
MGLVNAVVPHDKLDEEVELWCAEICSKSPTALALAKRSFNLDSEGIRAIGAMGFEALSLYYQTDEAKEGVAAFKEKRQPDFRRHVKR